MKPRVGQLIQPGVRLRAARSPIGSESRMPKNVAITAICRLSMIPLSDQLPAAEVRRKHARQEPVAVFQARSKTAPR